MDNIDMITLAVNQIRNAMKELACSKMVIAAIEENLNIIEANNVPWEITHEPAANDN